MTLLTDLPLRRKLSFAMLFTSSFALVAACALFLVVEYQGYRRNLMQTIATVSLVTADNSTASLAFADAASARQTLEALRAEPQIAAAALFNADGRRIAHYLARPDEPLPAGRPALSGVHLEDGQLVTVQPVIEGTRQLGTLYVRATQDAMFARMRTSVAIALGVLAFSLAVAALISAWLGGTLARPILELDRIASEVAAGQDYSLRARQYAQDEMGRLTMAFNTMMATTQKSVEALRRSQQAMAEARDRAIAASRTKDDFLAALSHELRTPLTPVLLLATEEAANPRLSADVRGDFEMIAKNVALEARLIDDLLDLTRITRGKLVLEQRAADAHSILRDALATVQPEFAAKGIEVAVTLAAPRSRMVGDPVRLQQIFWNVLKNAAKFTLPAGRVVVETAIVDRDRLRVKVTDSGIGMTPEELARIFDAFAQGDHARGPAAHQFGGLGLGLAISQRLVEMHRGSIRASSAGRGCGAVIEIELPLEPAAA
jgi:signal transduction histidine kinase